jgi:hypothetical protein
VESGQYGGRSASLCSPRSRRKAQDSNVAPSGRRPSLP